jgi:N-acetylmuramoyl-L-alanine amidase CwlA
VLINLWDNQETDKCVHAFIMDHEIVQTLPWDVKGWHAGSGKNGSYNSCSIGVEICEPAGHTYQGGTMIGYDVKKNADYFAKVYNNAVELFAFLCKKYSLDPLKDILCHCEVYKIGYGSNHSDVMQWFPKHGKSMDTFRADVKAAISKGDMSVKTITPESPKEDIAWAQRRFNDVLPTIPGLIPLNADGVYGPDTRIATLLYWRQLGWGKDMNDDGTKIGRSTMQALAARRKI